MVAPEWLHVDIFAEQHLHCCSFNESVHFHHEKKGKTQITNENSLGIHAGKTVDKSVTTSDDHLWPAHRQKTNTRARFIRKLIMTSTFSAWWTFWGVLCTHTLSKFDHFWCCSSTATDEYPRSCRFLRYSTFKTSVLSRILSLIEKKTTYSDYLS